MDLEAKLTTTTKTVIINDYYLLFFVICCCYLYHLLSINVALFIILASLNSHSGAYLGTRFGMKTEDVHRRTTS